MERIELMEEEEEEDGEQRERVMGRNTEEDPLVLIGRGWLPIRAPWGQHFDFLLGGALASSLGW